MGRDKALLSHPSGERFIDHAISQLAAACDDVCVAGTTDSKISGIGTIQLRDDVAYQGPIFGIVSALRYAQEHDFSACLVTPVDMPGLTVTDICKLKDCWIANDTMVCGVDDTQRLQPLVAIYPTDCLPTLSVFSKSDDRSLSRWLRSQAYHPVPLSSDACRNVNRPEDL
jgi:molybdopterin-guanine dinucleotide biosynthesis protein A